MDNLKPKHTIRLLALLAVAAGLGVHAQESTVQVYRDGRVWVEESSGMIVAPNARQLILRSERGSVTIRTGAAGEVRYQVRKLVYRRSEEEARELFREFVVQTRTVGTDVRIEGERRRLILAGYLNNFSVEYEVTVSSSFRVDIKTRGGSIEVEDAVRALRAVSGGGNIETADIAGEAQVETMGGSIQMGSVGGTLRARTAGGDIRVQDVQGAAMLETMGGEIVSGRVAGSVHAATAGGDIHISGATGDVFVRTAGGRILVGETDGRVQAETAGGSIRIVAAGGGVEAQTAGGEIELERVRALVRAKTVAGNILAHILEGKLASDSLLQTSFGDVELYLPAEFPVTIEATIEMSTGHKILTDFPLQIEGPKEPHYGAGRVRGFGELNGGGQRLKIQTVGGDIIIRKLTEETLERFRHRQMMRVRPRPKPQPKVKPKRPEPDL